jgi:hypothetical protein
MKTIFAQMRPVARAGMAFLAAVVFPFLPGGAQSASVQLTLNEQGTPVKGALVVLQRLKDSDCVKLFNNPSPTFREIQKAEKCVTDLPDGATDVNGKYSYQQLAAGWYDIRSLWSMQKPPAPSSAIACVTGDWQVVYEPGRDHTGKYDAMVQGRPFELKEGEARQISFDYINQFEAADCHRRVVNVRNPPNTGRARIAISGSRGVLELDPGQTAWHTELRQEGKEMYLTAMGRRDHLLVTAFLDQVSFAASAEKCRDERWPKERDALRSHDVDLGHITKITENGVARVEFFVDRGPGNSKVEMEDVHAYMGSGNLCAEVHLSKVGYRPEERKLFDEVLSSLRFLPEETAEPPAKQQ